MSRNSAIVARLEQRAQEADRIISHLRSQLKDLKNATVSNNGGREVSRLQAENAQLQAEVERALKRLVALETSHGVIQIPYPRPLTSQAGNQQGSEVSVQKPDPVAPDTTEAAEKAKPAPKKAKIEKKADQKEKKVGGPSMPTEEPSITQVDLRIGRIVDVKKHPDADTLYLEQIDIGEGSPRTVVSGLVKHVPMEEMQDRLVIMCCNLKPAKMRGVLSQAMVMCAATDDKVEILLPPEGVVPGDRVSCDGYALGDDFPPQMNPKKKIFEQIKPHLKTDANKVACYKGSPFKVEGKGLCVAPTLADANVR
ncbi:aminoacyl tRNA synthase complex-interacting multifunctional protein 1-like isoform X2 [Acanthaster planci]|nr:aminoacyl tRNA synthase complex-interacting multifunctional protein 1-like isoform X2 [Acanthaster planci]XP_022079452.1 aminoacyl tRNA synthase complex-interacting multifunctional protein 1-like isoform X2 [Acanthaster planci]XP_022079453.1 aminoacyl tRNA synthase complex-interacting multifunctional protein 1-like isoform X2 [Acanthaster planci]